MAHQGLRSRASSHRLGAAALVVCALSSAMVGCGEPTVDGARVNAPTRPDAPAKPVPQPEFAESTWGKFHSPRFQLTVPLPDGKAWKIDDHTQPYLVAKHAGTDSIVTAYTSFERELVNHQACEDRARALGLVPAAELRTVESALTVGPDAFDSRIWIAVDARARTTGAKDTRLTGHVFLFGAYIRRCLFVHLETSVPSADDEPKLSARLASARVQMLGELKIDPPRTTFESDGLRGPSK